MKLIFLDVDGVLNWIEDLIDGSNNNRRPYSGYDYPFDPKSLNNLKRIVEETDAYLVITSTWREHEIGKSILLSELKKYGLDERVIGYTEILHTSREEEILKYLEKLGDNISIIILDDFNDFKMLEEYLIQTNYRYGLTEKDAELAIKKLKRKDV